MATFGHFLGVPLPRLPGATDPQGSGPCRKGLAPGEGLRAVCDAQSDPQDAGEAHMARKPQKACTILVAGQTSAGDPSQRVGAESWRRFELKMSPVDHL